MGADGRKVCVRENDRKTSTLQMRNEEEAERRKEEVRRVWQEAGLCENPSFKVQPNLALFEAIKWNKIMLVLV